VVRIKPVDRPLAVEVDPPEEAGGKAKDDSR